ncbi:MAG: hypothetical protein Kow00121_60490 [Elainellaceae cyanobacterium]
MKADANQDIEQKTENIKSSINNPASVPPIALAYNGIDRNAWVLGLNPQQELWNGRLAMIGFIAYLLWDIAGYSVLRDVLHLVR